jgi:hypothetical protein
LGQAESRFSFTEMEKRAWEKEKERTLARMRELELENKRLKIDNTPMGHEVESMFIDQYNIEPKSPSEGDQHYSYQPKLPPHPTKLLQHDYKPLTKPFFPPEFEPVGVLGEAPKHIYVQKSIMKGTHPTEIAVIVMTSSNAYVLYLDGLIEKYQQPYNPASKPELFNKLHTHDHSNPIKGISVNQSNKNFFCMFADKTVKGIITSPDGDKFVELGYLPTTTDIQKIVLSGRYSERSMFVLINATELFEVDLLQKNGNQLRKIGDTYDMNGQATYAIADWVDAGKQKFLVTGGFEG